MFVKVFVLYACFTGLVKAVNNLSSTHFMPSLLYIKRRHSLFSKNHILFLSLWNKIIRQVKAKTLFNTSLDADLRSIPWMQIWKQLSYSNKSHSANSFGSRKKIPECENSLRYSITYSLTTNSHFMLVRVMVNLEHELELHPGWYTCPLQGNMYICSHTHSPLGAIRLSLLPCF